MEVQDNETKVLEENEILPALEQVITDTDSNTNNEELVDANDDETQEKLRGVFSEMRGLTEAPKEFIEKLNITSSAASYVLQIPANVQLDVSKEEDFFRLCKRVKSPENIYALLGDMKSAYDSANIWRFTAKELEANALLITDPQTLEIVNANTLQRIEIADPDNEGSTRHPSLDEFNEMLQTKLDRCEKVYTIGGETFDSLYKDKLSSTTFVREQMKIYLENELASLSQSEISDDLKEKHLKTTIPIFENYTDISYLVEGIKKFLVVNKKKIRKDIHKMKDKFKQRRIPDFYKSLQQEIGIQMLENAHMQLFALDSFDAPDHKIYLGDATNSILLYYLNSLIENMKIRGTISPQMQAKMLLMNLSDIKVGMYDCESLSDQEYLKAIHDQIVPTIYQFIKDNKIIFTE